MQVSFLPLLLLAGPATAVLRGTGDQKLMTDMRPDVVRKLLSSVEQKWIHTRAMVMSNITDMEEAYVEMEKSCIKVSTAVIAGSEGQKDRVSEYMQDVCSADSAHDQFDLCTGFASGIGAVMTDDSEYNRDSLQLSQFCRKFWDSAVTNAAQAEAKQRAEEAEKERIAKEEAEKKEREEKEREEKEAQKEAAAKAAQEAEEAAKVKASEAAEAAKAAELAKANVNQTSSQTKETTTDVEPEQVNSTVVQPSSNEQETNSTLTATSANSPTNSSSAVAAAPEQKSNSTEIAKPEVKSNSTEIAKTAVKNATTAIKK